MTDLCAQSTDLPWGLHRSDLAMAAATGLLTLPDPARRSQLGRFALRTAAAGTVAAGTWAGLGADPRYEFDPASRVALTVGGAGLMYGAAELGEAMDRALHRRLVRLGVGRPRLAMAVAGVGLALAMSVLDRRAAAEDVGEDGPAGPTSRELPAHARELVDAILGQTEDHDSLRLRAQLAVAREEVWGDEPVQRFVELSVPGDVLLAVPHTFTFPVSARFTSARGVPCVVQLLVAGGRLATVVVDVDSEVWDLLADDWDPQGGDPDPLADVGLPAAGDVTLVVETREGPQASLP